MENQFEDWFDTFQRDGGELMLYNTLDLEAAWNACSELKDEEIAALRAELDALKSQKPIGKWLTHEELSRTDGRTPVLWWASLQGTGAYVYARPVPAIPEGKLK